jgi:hypothetical protein
MMIDRTRFQNQANTPFPTVVLGGPALPSNDGYFGYFYFAYARALGGCPAPGRSCQK